MRALSNLPAPLHVCEPSTHSPDTSFGMKATKHTSKTHTPTPPNTARPSPLRPQTRRMENYKPSQYYFVLRRGSHSTFPLTPPGNTPTPEPLNLFEGSGAGVPLLQSSPNLKKPIRKKPLHPCFVFMWKTMASQSSPVRTARGTARRTTTPYTMCRRAFRAGLDLKERIKRAPQTQNKSYDFPTSPSKKRNKKQIPKRRFPHSSCLHRYASPPPTPPAACPAHVTTNTPNLLSVRALLPAPSPSPRARDRELDTCPSRFVRSHIRHEHHRRLINPRHCQTSFNTPPPAVRQSEKGNGENRVG